MLDRIRELEALRAPLQAEERSAFDQARAIGQALRGSGATFGFPELTALADLLEVSTDRQTLRRIEGLIPELRAIAADADVAADRFEWLLRAADLPLDGGDLAGAEDLTEAWGRVRVTSGLTDERLTHAVARYLELETADLATIERSALRLVPEALMAGGRIIPLREDSTTITVATSDPTSLRMELELQRVTGRAPILRVASPHDVHAALTDILGEQPATSGPRIRHASTDEIFDAGVLVVDDEAEARLMVRTLLEGRGFTVWDAGDGQEALAALETHPGIELIVSDLNMPNLDGLELIWAVRGDERSAHLPVIVVTGEVDQVLESQLLEEGADDYVRKPLDPRLFLARVEAALRRREG